MFDDDEIDALRAQLDGLVGPARLPVLTRIAQSLANRYNARARSGRPEVGPDLIEAAELLREARGMLNRRDVYRAQLAYSLGTLCAVRALGGGTDADRDEAIDCLTECAEHRDLPPSNVEVALLFSAMLLLVRAIPSGLDVLGGSGLSGGGLGGLLGNGNLLDPRAGPAALSQWRRAGSGPGNGDLDTCVAQLRRLMASPPVNPQLHAMAGTLLTQADLVRSMLSGDFAAMMVNIQAAMMLWGQGGPGFGPGFGHPSGGLDAVRALLPTIELPQLTQGPVEHPDH